MRDEDREAAFELAADLDYVNAAKFLRAELDCGLRAGIEHAARIARERPTSRLAESIRARDAWHATLHEPAT